MNISFQFAQAYDHRGAKIYITLFILLSCFGQDKQQALPAEWNPTRTQKALTERCKHTTLSRSALPPKITRGKTGMSNFPEGWQQFIGSWLPKWVQLTFLSSHICSPSNAVVTKPSSQDFKIRQIKTIITLGEKGEASSGYLNASHIELHVWRSNSYGCSFVFSAILNLGRKRQCQNYTSSVDQAHR